MSQSTAWASAIAGSSQRLTSIAKLGHDKQAAIISSCPLICSMSAMLVLLKWGYERHHIKVYDPSAVILSGLLLCIENVKCMQWEALCQMLNIWLMFVRVFFKELYRIAINNLVKHSTVYSLLWCSQIEGVLMWGSCIEF